MSVRQFDVGKRGWEDGSLGLAWFNGCSARGPVHEFGPSPFGDADVLRNWAGSRPPLALAVLAVVCQFESDCNVGFCNVKSWYLNRGAQFGGFVIETGDDRERRRQGQHRNAGLNYRCPLTAFQSLRSCPQRTAFRSDSGSSENTPIALSRSIRREIVSAKYWSSTFSSTRRCLVLITYPPIGMWRG